MKTKQVREKVTTLCGYELDGEVDDMIKTLQGLKDTYGPTVLLDYEQCQYDDDYEFNVYIVRDETNMERSKRLNRKKQEKARDDKWDREQYEKLKAKFGDS